MRLSLLLVLPLLLAMPAEAAQTLPAGSLWAQAATTAPDQIPALCDRIVANQNKNRTGMIDAAYLYFNGMLMGNRCVQLDYVKALDLLRQAGDRARFDNFVRLIKGRAAQGNSKAASALKKADLSPF